MGSLQQSNGGTVASAPSAIQKLLETHTLAVDSPHLKHLHQLALQVAHNLHYQHLWTGVRLHTTSPVTSKPLPRPLVSGLPPQRLYIHPDEQMELLRKQKAEGKTGMPELSSERMWVLPSHLREKWTLKRFGEVFDGIGVEVDLSGEVLFESDGDESGLEQRFDSLSTSGNPIDGSGFDPKPWQGIKRLLLATVEDDSTVVYYIVHDGIVKPRQN
ncbi:hypothetical protein MBLNU230_g0189t1 [Neophaeotheca triangularis]